jgi:hypothetical protein
MFENLGLEKSHRDLNQLSAVAAKLNDGVQGNCTDILRLKH